MKEYSDNFSSNISPLFNKVSDFRIVKGAPLIVIIPYPQEA